MGRLKVLSSPHFVITGCPFIVTGITAAVGPWLFISFSSILLINLQLFCQYYMHKKLFALSYFAIFWNTLDGVSLQPK